MARSHSRRRSKPDHPSEAIPIELRFEGGLADEGELPALDLANALQGWDRTIQLAYFSYQQAHLVLPDARTNIRSDLRIRTVGRGSIVVDGVVWLTDAVGQGLVGGGAIAAFIWGRKLIASYLAAKRRGGTLDAAVNEMEALAKDENVRVHRNREQSENFVASLDNALSYATVPLDSSVGRELLRTKGQAVEIAFDRSDRAVIRRPFDPPSLDPEADPVITAPVRFVRINKKTGTGLFQFVRPMDESQLGQQRFHCDDKSMRRRGNVYTGSFHVDEPLVVQMQRKAYETSRHGHYWLIVGAVQSPEQADTLF